MAGRIMFFGTINRSNFKHTIKRSYTGLFVELRALRQIGILVKILKFKDICPALCTYRHNFRRMDFGETVFQHESAKTLAYTLGYLKRCALTRVPNSYRTVF